tara:strand:- start:144 stop:1496 length:1353 start_codon:yes stop_codon:yes gene_type:complete
MANTYLSRSISGGNQKTFTLSVWVKRSEIGSNVYGTILSYADSVGGGGGTPRGEIIFYEDKLQFGINPTGNSWSTFNTGARRFRDVNGFYHIVVAVDTTQGTASNRLKMYVNGELQTLSSAPDTQNLNTGFNKNSSTNHIGRSTSGTGNFFSGCMSHYHFVDGSALAATVFGSVDSVTGEWQINTSPSFTPGTNGFTILKDGNTITDQSANSNNWSSNGAGVTKTQDCPSNVFATWNSLDRYYTQAIFSNGNATVQTPNASETYCTSTLGMSSGKYYMEVRTYDGSNQDNIGIVDSVATANNGSNNTYQKPYAWVYRSAGNVFNNDNNLGGTFASYQSNHNIMVAVDLDNNKIYFGKDGTWQNSGNPASGSTGTGGFSITASSSLPNGCYFFTVGDNTTGDDTTYRGNFGNGHFGSTAISSAGTNASGNGIFEYDVPSGYTALSTKGLNL